MLQEVSAIMVQHGKVKGFDKMIRMVTKEFAVSRDYAAKAMEDALEEYQENSHDYFIVDGLRQEYEKQLAVYDALNLQFGCRDSLRETMVVETERLNEMKEAFRKNYGDDKFNELIDLIDRQGVFTNEVHNTKQEKTSRENKNKKKK